MAQTSRTNEWSFLYGLFFRKPWDDEPNEQFPEAIIPFNRFSRENTKLSQNQRCVFSPKLFK
jgi:hypothetical protein